VERVLGHEDSVDGKLATIAGRHERGEVLPLGADWLAGYLTEF
jgi:hypothetical protein